MQKLQDKNAGEWEKMTVDDVKSLVDSSRITTMTENHHRKMRISPEIFGFQILRVVARAHNGR